MKALLRRLFPNHHPIRLFYHKIMAMAAAWMYGFPGWEMEIVAITGTNGKTTSSNFLHHILTKSGKKAGMLTTANFKIGEDEQVNNFKQTTLSPWVMQRKLREMQKAGCSIAVVEVTSHAMVQSRLWGVNVDTAVFTNLSHDHISYHGSMNAYKEAKGLLFKHLTRYPKKNGLQKSSVINQDDSEAEYYNSFKADRHFDYGIEKGDYTVKDLQLEVGGTRFLLDFPDQSMDAYLPIPGKMNIHNALAAACAAYAHGCSLESIVDAFEDMPTVPGRLELIDEGQPFTVLVDYAHSEDSLEKLLSMFREMTRGKLVLVFGATGGGRDVEKRPRMGAIAHRLADEVILTDDDPYEENSYEIAAMVKEGIPREEGDRFWQVINRREAIRLGLSLAQTEEDTVIVAGKGAEVFQVVGTQKVPHDDRAVVREYLAKAADVELPHS